MDISSFRALTANNPIRVIRDETEVAARHFVYKLYDTTDGQSMQWQILHGMRESAATISWAVERGLGRLQELRGKPLERKAALTDEGRRVARREGKQQS